MFPWQWTNTTFSFHRTKLCFDDDEDAHVILHHVTGQLPKPSTKRLFDNDDVSCDNVTFLCKRRRSLDYPTLSSYTTPSAAVVYSPVSSIIRAVERLSTETALVADGSRDNILPTISGKHKDLNAISPQTVNTITILIKEYFLFKIFKQSVSSFLNLSQCTTITNNNTKCYQLFRMFDVTLQLSLYFKF